MRGEFHRADGLVIPNNITTYGARMIFRWGLIGDSYNLFMGLANCNPDPELQLEDLNEPELGLNGYSRQAIEQSGVGWPIYGTFNGEQYFETKVVVFEAGGGNFAAVNRLALINHETSVVGEEVVALSSPLPDELIITPTTPVEERSFKYRIYGR